MDGELITELFTPDYLYEKPPVYDDRPLERREDGLEEWSSEAEAEITDRLRKLGYLG